MSNDNKSLMERVLELYKGPFSSNNGVIWDSKGSEVINDEAMANGVGEAVAEALTHYWNHNEIRSAAEELVAVANSTAESLNTCVMDEAIERMQNALCAKPLLVLPHTYGGFSGVFFVENKRKPTPQEIFDAGMRAGRDIFGVKPTSDKKE